MQTAMTGPFIAIYFRRLREARWRRGSLILLMALTGIDSK
jgi:hypothetical protein